MSSERHDYIIIYKDINGTDTVIQNAEDAKSAIEYVAKCVTVSAQKGFFIALNKEDASYVMTMKYELSIQ